jgi:hypothetical protein
LFRRPSSYYTIYEFVASHPEGVTREEMFQHLYGNRPSGGPASMNIMSVHLVKMNKRLAFKDRGIKSHRVGGKAHYTLRRLSTGNIWMPTT